MEIDHTKARSAGSSAPPTETPETGAEAGAGAGAPAPTPARRWLRELRGFAEALLLALLVTTFGATTVGVAGTSMEPTLDGNQRTRLEALVAGDRLLIPKYETWLRRARLMPGYERGTVVVAREPATSAYAHDGRVLVVKRVIGVPGDVVEVRGGRVFVNGAELDQSFITDGGVSLGRGTHGPVRLGAGEYWLMGDNRTRSNDSRAYGPVAFMAITGRAAACIWPLRREGAWYPHALGVPDGFAAIPDAPPATGVR